jgi:hypothetical protein
MKFANKITRTVLAIFTISVVLMSCQKMTRPGLGDYPKDANPPGGPLKFFAAFDATNVDSVRANFGVDNNATYTAGVSGKAFTGGANGYVSYAGANDFKGSTSFTIAMWLKKNGPNPAGAGTSFAFGFATSTDIWTRQDIFLLFEDAGNPSSVDSAAAKFYVLDQWFEFTGNRRLPKVLNNQWHHLAFVFDQATSTMTPYLDGAPVAGLPAGFGKFNNNGGKIDFAKVTGLVVGGPGHWAVGKTPDGWMGNWNGQIDNFRLYGKALTTGEVNALFTTKM